MARAIDRELQLPYVQGEGAYYIMLDESRYGPSMDTAVSLLAERVITVPGSAFGAEGEGFLSLSFSIETPLIEEGIRRLAKGLGNRTNTDQADSTNAHGLGIQK